MPPWKPEPGYGDFAGSQHLDVVIGRAEQRVLQIDDVAAHVDRDDLAAAVSGQLVAVGKARKQKAGILRLVAVPHQELGGLNLP